MGPLGYLVTIGEFFGGLGLILGFLTRFSAASLIVIMIGAIAMVHGKNGFFFERERIRIQPRPHRTAATDLPRRTWQTLDRPILRRQNGPTPIVPSSSSNNLTNKAKLPMKYVDGFVLPVPKKNIAAYRRIARKAGKIRATRRPRILRVRR